MFDLSLEETANALDSTLGAVKAALHRGRAKLNELSGELQLPNPAANSPRAALLDRFVAAFNARDLTQIVSMIREDATSEMVGMGIEYGRAAIGRKSEKSALYVSFMSSSAEWRVERRDYRGESILLSWVKEGHKEFVNDIIRLEEREGAICRLRYYFFCPEIIIEVCCELGIASKTNGYRYGLN